MHCIHRWLDPLQIRPCQAPRRASAPAYHLSVFCLRSVKLQGRGEGHIYTRRERAIEVKGRQRVSTTYYMIAKSVPGLQVLLGGRSWRA